MSAATKPSAWRNMMGSEQQESRDSLQRLVDDLVVPCLNYACQDLAVTELNGAVHSHSQGRSKQNLLLLDLPWARRV